MYNDSPLWMDVMVALSLLSLQPGSSPSGSMLGYIPNFEKEKEKSQHNWICINHYLKEFHTYFETKFVLVLISEVYSDI